LKVETSKEGKIICLTIKAYDFRKDYNQLKAIISSYESFYPFYQHKLKGQEGYVLINFGGYLSFNTLETFDNYLWEYVLQFKEKEKEQND
jgi:hypothetical protein